MLSACAKSSENIVDVEYVKIYFLALASDWPKLYTTEALDLASIFAGGRCQFLIHKTLLALKIEYLESVFIARQKAYDSIVLMALNDSKASRQK